MGAWAKTTTDIAKVEAMVNNGTMNDAAVDKFRNDLCVAIRKVWDAYNDPKPANATGDVQTYSADAIMRTLASDPDRKYGPYRDDPNPAQQALAVFANAKDAELVHVLGRFGEWLFPQRGGLNAVLAHLN